MKWAKERDSLIAQTRAFVNSVIVWKADTETAQSRASVEPVAIENTFAVEASASAEAAVAVEKLENSGPTQALPTAELPSAQDTARSKDAVQNDDTMQMDVRKEIQSRVAAFQAHQHRFAREREAYFNSVLTKARSATTTDRDDSDGDAPSA